MAPCERQISGQIIMETLAEYLPNKLQFSHHLFFSLLGVKKSVIYSSLKLQKMWKGWLRKTF